MRWYGIAYLIGFVAAYAVMRSLVRRWKITLSDDDMLNIVLAAVIGVLLGGRLGYVLLYGGAEYLRDPLRVFAVWDGGMSFHGGLAGILVAGAIVSWRMGIPWLTLVRHRVGRRAGGLFFGRIANFVNDELWGRVTTVPWGWYSRLGGRCPGTPSQLYEAALEGLVTLAVVSDRNAGPVPSRGVIFGWLLVLYGTFRIFVEFFREPDAQIGFLWGWRHHGPALSVPVLLVGGFAPPLVAWSLWRVFPRRAGLIDIGQRPSLITRRCPPGFQHGASVWRQWSASPLEWLGRRH